MNQTIYFRKDVWSKFEKEEKKSELINHLLTEHYDDVDVAEVIKAIDPKPPKKEGLPKINIINTPTPKFCKHGNPKGLCMDKQASRLKCNV
jgi:hypothetical protein